jgi:hypothetical protein
MSDSGSQAYAFMHAVKAERIPTPKSNRQPAHSLYLAGGRQLGAFWFIVIPIWFWWYRSGFFFSQ